MSQLIDISPPISTRLAVWPGDVAYSRTSSLRIADGATVDLSAIHTTVHLGAHADAPNHYQNGAAGIAAQALEAYYGPCQVVAVKKQRGTRIFPSDLTAEVTAPRVLLKTGSFPDPETFTEDFNSLSPELIEHCHARGVVLIGIDTPSVDPFADKELRSHHALLAHGVANLEGLWLREVNPGRYTLIALPLRLEGADASPVRAALVADERGESLPA
jgi:arylformamidase